MAYGVDAYGRPIDPNAQSTTPASGAGGAAPSTQGAQSDPSDPMASAPTAARTDNTSPQQQGQQPASTSAGFLSGDGNTGINGGAQNPPVLSGQGVPSPLGKQNTTGQNPGATATASSGYGTPQDAISALYAQHGVQDGGAGSGFTDANYWAQQAQATGGWSDYWNNRLNSDLSGTGTDAGGNNPVQAQAAGQPGIQGTWQQYMAGQLPNQTNAQAGQNAFQYNTQAMPSYQAGQLSTQQLPAYMAAQLAQYQQPSQAQGTNDQMGGLVNQLLANPNSMSDQNVAQLNEQNKAQAISMQQQQQGQNAQAMAANGTYGSGQQIANDQRSREDAMNTVLSGNRSTALQQMTQNRSDQLNALTAGQNYSNQLTQQQQGNYASQLGGQQAQATQNLQAQQSQASQVQYNLQQQLAQQGLYQQQAQSQQAATQYGFNVQQAQNAANVGQQNYGLQQAMDQQGLYQSSAQINNQSMAGQLANQLAQAQLAQNNSQFNLNLGARYAGV